MIQVSKPSIGKDELEEIDKVLKTGWLGLGSTVYQFEQELKKFFTARNVIAVNTGTSALHIALASANIKSGDEVIVPSLTFVASVQAILACGATPVFCEVREDTLNMDTEDVVRRISSKTKAIMPVHYGGMACDMNKILEICSKHRLMCIEDAAHAFGSKYKDKLIGSFGDITCFSFDPIKTITCGEGGAVVTSNDELANKIIKKRILGIDKDTWKRYQNERSWFYEVVTDGFRYHMSNINAAIGIAQLNKYSHFAEKRKNISKKYDDAFRTIDSIEIIKRDYDEVVPFIYTMKVKNGRRDPLMSYLNKKGIGTGINYIPNHIQPLFKKQNNDLKVTDKIFKEIITLPLYTDMSDDDQGLVIKEIIQFLRREHA